MKPKKLAELIGETAMHFTGRIGRYYQTRAAKYCDNGQNNNERIIHFPHFHFSTPFECVTQIKTNEHEKTRPREARNLRYYLYPYGLMASN